ncbi:alkaline phosphatase D family protein [Roseibacillus ishigakijimensis]
MAKPPLPTPLETPVIGEWDQYFLDRLYPAQEKDLALAAIVEEERFRHLVAKHELKLLGGPLVGCLSATGASIWVRTPGPAKVQVIAGDHRSEIRETGPAGDFATILSLEGLQPFQRYSYDVLVEGESVFGSDLPSFRTYPEAGSRERYALGFGGCARYNPPKEKMWSLIADHELAAFLLLGDNVYIDQPHSRTKQRVHYYRRQLSPDFSRFTRSTGVYAIYDDHDLGKDDSVGGPEKFTPAWKWKAWQVFRENWNNPAYGGGEKLPGCWFNFSLGKVEVFMLDNRYYRDFENGTMLGPEQKQWLLRELKESTATFKILASGTLWTEHADKGGRDSWWGVPEEREEIFRFLEDEKIGGVILLSSDRHRSDVYRIERPESYDLYEFESGKITNEHTHDRNEKALFSYNEGNFFGKLNFDFEKEDPEVTFQIVTLEDKVAYEMTLRASELQAGRQR